MVAFWVLTAAMTAAALAFVLVPLLRAHARTGPGETEANLEVLRGQRREIEADVAAGTLPADAREEALEELVDRAAGDLSPAGASTTTSMGKPWRVAAAIAAAVPALAFGMYLAIGSPRALDPVAVAPREGKLDEKQIVTMVESLATKVKDRPGDAQGWALLARSMASIGRFPEAADAYAHLAKLVPGDAQVLADYADVLGMVQGRKLAGRPAELARQALEIDPGNSKALALAGTAAMDAGDFAQALRHWQALAAQLPPDSDDARQVGHILGEIRQQAQAAGKAPSATVNAPRKILEVAEKSVSGSVALSPEIASRLSGGETVFIFARAEGGARLPLAVLRASARELPMKFALDDSQAMAPGNNLSSASAVRVEARVSRSGDATPRSGDLVGTSAVVKPGARDVNILVDKVLP